MSDFLTRLAERSLGLAPTVRPRVPSLFEPGPAPPFPTEPTPDDISFVEGPPETHSPGRAIGRRDPGPRAEDLPLREPSAESREVAPREVSPPTRLVEGTAPAPKAARPAMIAGPGSIEAAPPYAPNAEISIERPRPLDRPSARVERPPMEEEKSPGPPVDLAEGAPARRPRPDPDLAASRPGVAGRAAPSPFEAGGSRESVAAPKVVPLRPPEEPILRERPTIRVRIGRVEVRVVTPSPAPARPAPARGPAGPRLSLDDYLRDRSGADHR